MKMVVTVSAVAIVPTAAATKHLTAESAALDFATDAFSYLKTVAADDPAQTAPRRCMVGMAAALS